MIRKMNGQNIADGVREVYTAALRSCSLCGGPDCSGLCEGSASDASSPEGLADWLWKRGMEREAAMVRGLRDRAEAAEAALDTERPAPGPGNEQEQP